MLLCAVGLCAFRIVYQHMFFSCDVFVRIWVGLHCSLIFVALNVLSALPRFRSKCSIFDKEMCVKQPRTSIREAEKSHASWKWNDS